MTELSKEGLPSEHIEQVRLVSMFRKTWPCVRIIAIPNGGWRDIRTAARLKAEGVTPGVPDLFIPEWGVFIEMKKRSGGRVSAAQRDWLRYLNSVGYHAFVCAGADDAVRILKEGDRFVAAPGRLE